MKIPQQLISDPEEIQDLKLQINKLSKNNQLILLDYLKLICKTKSSKYETGDVAWPVAYSLYDYYVRKHLKSAAHFYSLQELEEKIPIKWNVSYE